MNTTGYLILTVFFLSMSGCDLSSDPDPRDERPAARCVDGVFSSGALYRVCIPDYWTAETDDLIIFSPGYTNPESPLSIPDWQIGSEGMSLSDVARSLGYGFATTSFRANGLLEPEWVSEDLIDLVDRFSNEFGDPRHSYLIGFSQGGIITTLAIEQFPETAGGYFDGGLAACGPLGDFRMQFDYKSHFRVLFDYFFGDELPDWPVWSQDIDAGDPGYMDENLMQEWSSTWAPLLATLARDEMYADLFDRLFSMTNAPPDDNAIFPYQNTLTQILWYGIFGTNDAVDKLGGMPFDNSDYIYAGSEDDTMLNDQIERFRKSANIREKIDAITASGILQVPLVTMHTTADQVVPNLHALEYGEKVLANQSERHHTHFEIDRYGHCNFTFEEILAGFSVLTENVTAKPLEVPESLFDDEIKKSKYIELMRQHGAKHAIVYN